MQSVAVIVVTFNQMALTLECLAALVAAGIEEAAIWVVDNGSEPRALPAIRSRFSQIRVLRSDRNLGFAGGCNMGARAAFSAGAGSILLLNNDALVEPMTIPKLTAVLESDTRIAAVSPKVYYHGTPRIIQSVGLRVDPNSGTARMIGSNDPDRGQYDRPMEPDALFGCALLIRRQAWEHIGEFWEPFFNYAEEVDWCLRARRLGWRLRCIPEAVVWHRTSSSLGSNSSLKAYLIARNQLYLRQRHQQGGWHGYWGLAYAIYRLARTAFRYLRLRQRPQARAIILAVWDYCLSRTGNSRASDLRLRKSTPTSIL